MSTSMPANTKGTSIETLRSRFKGNKKGRKSDAEKKFEKELKKARLFTSEAHEKFPKYKKMILGNFLVNVVSIFEVYLKDLIVQNKNWSEQGYAELLKDKKISLNEAFEIFQKDKITRQYMVAHFYSFQSLSNIEQVLGGLTGEKHFLNEIEKVGFGYGGSAEFQSFKEKFPHCRRDLSELYKLRNAFVHEGVLEDMHLINVDKVFNLISFFQRAIDGFVYIKVTSKK